MASSTIATVLAEIDAHELRIEGLTAELERAKRARDERANRLSALAFESSPDRMPIVCMGRVLLFGMLPHNQVLVSRFVTQE